MRMGHKARSDHSDHNLPHMEVKKCCATTSKKKKRSEEVGGGARVKEGESSNI